ncbi:MAG: lytic murein transglycosylase, partial [Vicinamibacterales bacterium]
MGMLRAAMAAVLLVVVLADGPLWPSGAAAFGLGSVAAGQESAPVAPVAPVPPLPLPPFEVWLAELRTEAEARGIRPEIIERALANVEQPVAQILERDRTQAEFTLDLDGYLKRRLTVPTVRMARQMYKRHRT